MLTLGNFENWGELSKRLTIPFFVVACINQIGTNKIDQISIYMLPIYFLFVVAAALIIEKVIYEVIKFLEIVAHAVIPTKIYKPGRVFSFFAISFISFGLLGFYKIGFLVQIKDTWFIASGLYGLYMLELHIQAIKGMKNG